MATLSDFYTSQNKPLPSMTDRAQLFQQLGLGSAAAYSGTTDQNTALLDRLSGPTNNSSPQQTQQQSGGNVPISGFGQALDTAFKTGVNTVSNFLNTPVNQNTTPISMPDFNKPLSDNSYVNAVTQPFKNYFNPNTDALTGQSTVIQTPGISGIGPTNEELAAQQAQTQTQISTGQQKPQRTFKKIGLDIYETTNGILQHVTDLASTGLNKSDPNWWNKLESIDVNTLSESEKQLVNRISNEQWGQPVTTTSQFAPVSQISGSELVTGEQKPEVDKMTKSQQDSYINNQVGNIVNTGQSNQNAYTPPQATNGNNQYYKEWNTATNTWDIHNIDGTKLDALPAGINADHINTKSAIKQFGGVDIKDDTDDKPLYSGPDPDLKARADKIQADIDALKTRDPFSGQTISDVRKSLNDEVGISKIYEDRNTIQGKINEIVNTYEKIEGEINESPNLTLALKERRGKFLDQQRLNIINPLTRNLDALNERIRQGEKTVTERLGDMVSQYNIYRNQVNDLQSAYDKLQGQMDKVSDNARQAFNTLMANPELMKDITKEEIEFINKNGYYPQSLIERTSKNTGGKEVKSFVTAQTSPTTSTTYGLDKHGNVVSSFTYSDVSKAGSGNSPYSNVSFKDNGDGTFTAVGISNSTGLPISIGTVAAGKESKDYLINQYTDWLKKHQYEYSGDQLRAVLGSIPGLNTVNLTENKPLYDLIDQYDRRAFTNDPEPETKDAVTAFTTYISTKSYKVTGSDGSTTKTLTPEQAQQLTAQGYTVVPQ